MTEGISPEKLRQRKRMAWIAHISLVTIALGVFFRHEDLGVNQTQVLISIVYVFGGIVLFYNGVTGFEYWTNRKHRSTNEEK